MTKPRAQAPLGPSQTTPEPRLRDIDYAAVAVKKAIEEKFSRANELAGLAVTAHESTIVVEDGARRGEGTRDNLLAALRKSATYDDLWRHFKAIAPKK